MILASPDSARAGSPEGVSRIVSWRRVSMSPSITDKKRAYGPNTAMNESGAELVQVTQSFGKRAEL